MQFIDIDDDRGGECGRLYFQRERQGIGAGWCEIWELSNQNLGKKMISED
jgi:hypothetical protein